ncbi:MULTISPECIES: AAA family ATPase [Vibrio]|uniref:AAA family ATPase n=1 Tax=Vibrio TaxID=662 RepID=UPI00047521F9|nr:MULTISPECIES: division plane positioning ATPase MipZ [Vibrio]
MITIIGCNKGGAGKTTTAVNIAVGLAMRGEDVVLVDADAQRSSSRWYAERENIGLLPRLTLIEKRDNIAQTLSSLNEKFSHVLVDVAGRNSRELITGASVADVIIAPHQCSQLDLDTLSELNEQVVRIRDLNPNLKAFVYHSMASTNHVVKDTERREFCEYVEEFEALSLLSSISFYRKIYKDVISEGKSVLEVDNLSAKEEVKKLIEEVFYHG